MTLANTRKGRRKEMRMTVSNWKRSLFCLILSIADTGHPGNAYSDASPHHFPVALYSSPCFVFAPLSSSNFAFLIVFLCISTPHGDEVTAGEPGRVFEVDVRNGFCGERYSQTFRFFCSGFFVRRIQIRFGLWMSPLGEDQVSFGTWRRTWIGSLPGWFASIALSCFSLFCPLALHFYCYYYSTDMSNLFCLPKIPEMATGSDVAWNRNPGYSLEIR